MTRAGIIIPIHRDRSVPTPPNSSGVCHASESRHFRGAIVLLLSDAARPGPTHARPGAGEKLAGFTNPSEIIALHEKLDLPGNQEKNGVLYMDGHVESKPRAEVEAALGK